ncbi:MAG: error-prone DNA polymerase [Sphingomonadaceae bacterium]
MTGFAELGAMTAFSFLEGASHPSDMVARAIELGLAGIGIADRNSVAGVVRAHVALRTARDSAREQGLDPPGFRLAVGARLAFADGTPDILAYPADRAAWGRLTRLLTVGRLRAKKGDCRLGLDDLMAHEAGLMMIAMAGPGERAALARLARAAPGRLWLGAAMPRLGDDERRLAQRRALALELGLPLIATNEPLYAAPRDRPLQDVLSCIRLRTTLAAAGRQLLPNAERHLKPAHEMARLFRSHPEALQESLRFLERIRFSLDELAHDYPMEPVPEGWTPQAWLEHLVMAAAHARYGAELPAGVRRRLDEEFALIAKQGYACYFLTVHDLVRFARAQDPPILCQGRGSAANSIVCFLLGITSVDPEKHDLLFSRFVSEERAEPPDIDVDFEHERREAVMQHVYRRYGRHRAGIVATVIHYRPKRAVREVAKVLGLSEDVAARLSSTVWGSHAATMDEARYREAGADPDNPQIAQLIALVDRLLGLPRHLSQHVGGFVLTQGRLDETVPILNAAMPERTFIEWDKDDIDALGLMKVDVLALGMLSCIRRAFELMRAQGLGDWTLELDGGADDAQVYDMLCRGDSIGVFQVESRAQMNMLPRLKPRCLYDLTIQVAIVRPGPIEGEMVHPYLRRRAGLEPVSFPSPAPPHDPDELKRLLGKTCGVPLFQEQAMKLAIVAAGFTPSEANQLRRAMATFRNSGTIHLLREKLVEGMVARGYARDFAERCWRQIEGFGSYGFPESHALAFARLVYVSAWIKCHQPAVFAAALLNSQPMGFYAPAQIVRDAREHGVEVRPVDVSASHWDCTLERDASGALALRLGLRLISGFRRDWAEAIVVARAAAGPFADLEVLARRAGLPPPALRLLAEADALGGLGFSRREALWDARRIPADELPLFAAAGAAELGEEPAILLPAMPEAEEVVADYQAIRLSLRRHPLAFLRAGLAAEGVVRAVDLAGLAAGARAAVAGVVLVRQRPGKGNAIFVTLEDETGVANLVIWARRFERMRRPVMAARLMRAEGVVQKSPDGVIHLLVDRVRDESHLLARLDGELPDGLPAGRAGHPRAARVLPRSRDFH